MSAFLPDQVIEEILSRSPVQSLLRFRSVCKTWCNLISDHSFIRLHLDRSIQRNAIKFGIFEFDMLYWSDLKNSCCDVETIVSEWHYLGSCDGLFFSVTGEDGNQIAIFNPSTRTNMLVEQEKDITDELNAREVFYDSISASYKLLITTYVTSTSYAVNVYNFRNKTWKNIGHISYDIEVGEGILLSGALHWIAELTGENKRRVILAFNLKDEIFLEMELPKDNGELTKWENNLCLLCAHEKKTILVMIMKEYGNKDSWTNLFIIQSPGVEMHAVYPIHMTANGKMMFNIGTKEKEKATLMRFGVFVCDKEYQILEKIEFVTNDLLTGTKKGLESSYYSLRSNIESLLGYQQITGQRHR